MHLTQISAHCHCTDIVTTSSSPFCAVANILEPIFLMEHNSWTDNCCQWAERSETEVVFIPTSRKSVFITLKVLWSYFGQDLLVIWFFKNVNIKITLKKIHYVVLPFCHQHSTTLSLCSSINVLTAPYKTNEISPQIFLITSAMRPYCLFRGKFFTWPGP